MICLLDGEKALRDEQHEWLPRAIGVLDMVAPAVSRLPTFVLVGLAASMTSVSDVQASNIPGLGHTAYLAGAQITRTFPFGPRPGVAAMVTMLSYDGTCCIGFNFDPGQKVTWRIVAWTAARDPIPASALRTIPTSPTTTGTPRRSSWGQARATISGPIPATSPLIPMQEPQPSLHSNPGL